MPHIKGVHKNSGYFEALIISGRLKITQDKLGYFDYLLTYDDKGSGQFNFLNKAKDSLDNFYNLWRFF